MRKAKPDRGWIWCVLLAVLFTVIFAVSSCRGADPEILDFYADWCGPCKAMQPIVDDLVAKGWPIRRVDFDQDKATASKWSVTQLPTYIAVLDGRELGRVVGTCQWHQITGLILNEPPRNLIPEPAVVRVGDRRVESERGQQVEAIYWGTGAIVARGGGKAVVSTAYHTFRGGNFQPVVKFWDGFEATGQVVAKSERDELVLVVCEDRGIDPLPIAEADPPLGERVTGYGWGGGDLAVIPGQIVAGEGKSQWLHCSGAQRFGDSGSPLLDARRQIVGCAWGFGQNMRRCTHVGPLRQMLRDILGVQLAPAPKPGPAKPSAGQGTFNPVKPVLPLVPVPGRQAHPPQPSQPAQPGTAAPAGSDNSGAAVPPAPASTGAQAAIEPQAPAPAIAPQPAETIPARPQEPQPASAGSNPEGLSPTPGQVATPADAPTLPKIAEQLTSPAQQALGQAVTTAASGFIAEWLPSLALGSAAAGGPLGLLAVWLARRAAVRIVTRATTTTTERPVVIPAQTRTENVYVGVPTADKWAEARLAAERYLARTDPQAARFFTYRDQLAEPQLAPKN